MRHLLHWVRPRGGRETIIRAIRIVVDFVFHEDEFQDYCKGTSLLELEEKEVENIFWAVERLRQFAEVFERAPDEDIQSET